MEVPNGARFLEVEVIHARKDIPPAPDLRPVAAFTLDLQDDSVSAYRTCVRLEKEARGRSDARSCSNFNVRFQKPLTSRGH